jgi:hypothetical protein
MPVSRDWVIAHASALINSIMSMRRLVLIAEQFRLMSLLLENREAAIANRFLPLLTAHVQKMSYADKTAVERAHPGALAKLTDPQIGAFNDDGIRAARETFAQLILDMIWNADPSPKKAYATWMLTRYVSAKNEESRIALEDLERTRGYLQLYDRVKNRLPAEHKDINRFRSTDDLFDAIKNFRENEKGEIITQDFEKSMYAQAEVIYNGPDYEILIPKTKEASMFFGRGTEWCTAYAPPKTNNMFDYYNNLGPLYIVRDKSTEARWQFHLEWKPPQYMDEHDRSIDIQEFSKAHPKVAEVFDTYFNAESWEVVADLAKSGLCVYFGQVGDGYGVRVTKPGVKFGGLIRDEVRLSIVTDKARVITSVTGDPRGGEAYEEVLRSTLDALKIKGNHETLTEKDFVWTKSGGWKDIESHEPDFVRKNNGWTYSARKIDFSKDSFMIYVDERGEDYEKSGGDDVATITASDGFFAIKEHKGYRWHDEHDITIAEVLLKFMPETQEFNRNNSNTRCPDQLSDKRPQWVGVAELFRAVGLTPLVRERAVSWLSSVSGHMPRDKFEWVGDQLIVDRHKDIAALVEQEGGDTIKSIMAASTGGNDQMDFYHSIEPDDYNKRNMLQTLEKSDPKLFGGLVRYLKSEFELELEDAGIDLKDADDIMSFIEEHGDVGLDESFTSAYSDAASAGAESEAHSSMWSALEHKHLLYFVDGKWQKAPAWDAEVAVVADLDTFIAQCTNYDDIEEGDLNEGGHGRFIAAFDEKLEVDEPRYGWSGHEDSVEAERFAELVSEFVVDPDD